MRRPTAPRARNLQMQPRAATRPLHAATPSDPALDQLQARADGSSTVAQLQTLQSRASEVLQREVDTSSSPSLGRGDPNYEYPLPARDGVPEWATKDYQKAPNQLPITDSAGGYYATGTLPWDRSGAVTEEIKAEFKDPYIPLMCSTIGGKIGSIYFEGGRVRTTHKGGPTTAERGDEQTFQYNIDRDAAMQIYDSSGDRARLEAENAKKPPNKRLGATKLFNRWIARQLKGQGVTATPAWAIPLNSPEDAFESSADADASGLKLFEVMVNSKGHLRNHPSRGAAAQINIKASDLEKLKAAGKLFEDKKDPKTANELFYKYVEENLPHLLGALRHPSEIKYKKKKGGK